MTKEQWLIAAKRADFNALAKELQISPVLARLIRNRDLTEVSEMREYLYGTLSDLPDPSLMKDITKGADIILEKIETGRKIRIISDYDVDGVSSNYILYVGLRKCGADADYRIPDRKEDGYGINAHLIEQAAADGIDTIITCDNGIAAKKEIDLGNSLGLTFVITDHHDIPYEIIDGKKKEVLPDAAAVINPKREDCPYPNKNICGAVVAWKLIQVLYDRLGCSGENFQEFLEVAALATVCDVMPLKGENRIIVKEGLKWINQSPIPGLKALIEENSLTEKEIRAYHLGFIIGPCVNASGRLSTAAKALKLLLAQDRDLCAEGARELSELNNERKKMTLAGIENAIDFIEESEIIQDRIYVIHLPDCHDSIAGIIAGRIREIYNRPVFVITGAEDEVKGSGRSIDAYNMYQGMAEVKECFIQFGGHPKAAGFSMKRDRIGELREKLNRNTSLTQDDLIPRIHIDIALPVSRLDQDLIEEMGNLEPCGTGNPRPLFAQKNLCISGIRELGTSGRALKLFLKDPAGYPIEAVFFGEVSEFYRDVCDIAGEQELIKMKRGQHHHVLLTCVYYPEINEWNGNRRIQIIIKNYRLSLQSRAEYSVNRC